MSRKVLIVDDDAQVRSFFRFVLEDQGYEPIEAGTVRDAWNLFQAHQSELVGVLMDGELPEHTDELVRKIRGVWQGPMIATASRRGPELLAAGCTVAINKSAGLEAFEKAIIKFFR